MGAGSAVRRAVFLDRDGVLNAALLDAARRPVPPRVREEFAILPGVSEACASLRAAGFMLIGCTNQPDIARGTTPREFVDWVNQSVVQAAGLDEMRLCPHDDAEQCHCRKPRPGMLTDAAAAHGIDLSRSWMVGDRWRDVAAGQAAGCRTIFIQRFYAEAAPVQPPEAIAADLPQAAAIILKDFP
jgi:D-glycero-D-manno-heptose 1,7-bisphosphate phosphatase